MDHTDIHTLKCLYKWIPSIVRIWQNYEAHKQGFTPFIPSTEKFIEAISVSIEPDTLMAHLKNIFLLGWCFSHFNSLA